MSHSNSMKIIEKAYADHAKDLVKWALRRFKSREDAEDLCSEVMSRFTKNILAKEAEGEEITNVDSYLWGIAYNLMNSYYADEEKKMKLVEELETELNVGTPFMVSEPDDVGTHISLTDTINGVPTLTDAINGIPTTEILLKKLHLSISQLDYNLREAMIMFHLEKKSLSEISRRLKVTESYVKKLLFEGRQKIRQNDKNGLYQTDKVFRPKRVRMVMSGERQDSYNHKPIEESLSKQNICLACYDKPCSIEELSQRLGLPSAYIEWDIVWLVENGFLKKQRNKYSTMFWIFDGTFETRQANIFFKHKSQCFDKLIDVLTAHGDKIKAIGFIGCEKPINHLLWLLIYSFIDLIAWSPIHQEEVGSSFEFRNTKTGEPYFSWGVFSTASTIPTDLQFMEKYIELKKWLRIGSSTYDEDNGNQLSQIDFIKTDHYLPTSLSYSTQPFSFWHYKDFIYKIYTPGFDISGLNDDERYKLSQCIDMGILSIGEDGVSVIPHIYVFTLAQRKEFEDVLKECLAEMKAELSELYREVRAMCKECLPKQLEGFLDMVSIISFIGCNLYATGFAYYDGKLFVPEGVSDYTLLTVNVTTGG